MASISAWLFFSAGAGAGSAALAGAAAAGLGAAGFGSETGAGRGASALATTGFAGSEFTVAAAAAGLASSSEMIRLIDARISSIEGSCAFAGWFISDSTSSAWERKGRTRSQRIASAPLQKVRHRNI
jgi:hypothetical protein